MSLVTKCHSTTNLSYPFYAVLKGSLKGNSQDYLQGWVWFSVLTVMRTCCDPPLNLLKPWRGNCLFFTQISNIYKKIQSKDVKYCSYYCMWVNQWHRKKKKISKSMQCRKQCSSTEIYIVKCVLLQKLRKIITRAENNWKDTGSMVSINTPTMKKT